MSLFSGKPRYHGSFIKDHSLSLVLGGIMVLQLIVVIVSGYYIFQWIEWSPDMPVSFGTALLIWLIFSVTLSIVADTYGALLLVLASKFFYEQGSAESNDIDN